MLAVLLLGACEKQESQANGLAEQNFIELGEDGATSLLLAEMNANIAVTSDELTEELKAGLLLMREEEKLAHDLYVAFNELYDLRIFANISNSESNHMEAMLMLLNAFELEDPVMDEAGKFTNDELQKAYNDLFASGELSVEDALKNGAYVEELDILDLEKLLEDIEDESVEMVYTNLLRGSRNHLRAFNRVLERYGVDYEPQLLSESYFNEIVAGDMERGGQGQKGRHGFGRACGNNK